MASVYFDRQTGKYYRTDENGQIIKNPTRNSTGRYENVVKKSTSGNRIYRKPKTVRVYIDKARTMIAVLCTTCILVGGGLTAAGMAAIDNFQNEAIVYDYSKEFRINGIDENTKGTKSGEYFYYEYDDIHDYMTRDGADYSQEVYLAYRNLGEHQMDRLFSEGAKTGPNSLQEFVENRGYDSIEQWADAEHDELLLRHEMEEKGYELKRMTNENEQAKSELDSFYRDNNYGGK